MKRTLLLLITMFFTMTAFAITCPSVIHKAGGRWRAWHDGVSWVSWNPDVTPSGFPSKFNISAFFIAADINSPHQLFCDYMDTSMHSINMVMKHPDRITRPKHHHSAWGYKQPDGSYTCYGSGKAGIDYCYFDRA